MPESMSPRQLLFVCSLGPHCVHSVRKHAQLSVSILVQDMNVSVYTGRAMQVSMPSGSRISRDGTNNMVPEESRSATSNLAVPCGRTLTFPMSIERLTVISHKPPRGVSAQTNSSEMSVTVVARQPSTRQSQLPGSRRPRSSTL